MRKVLIPTKLNKVAAETLSANGNYEVIQDESSDMITLTKKHPDTYALIVRSEKVIAEVIDALPKLKVIIRAGSGFNTIDTKHARKKGIDVMNTPGANANAVAEEVVALMLADARHVVTADQSTRNGKWEKKKFMGREVSEKTVGIIGLGNIGRLVAKRLSGFDVRLLGYDSVISHERAEEINVELTDLKTLFTESDYITLHIPENKETKGLVNSKLLSLMKDGATIINCARAGIVDEDALRKVKKEKGIRFLNDVYNKDAEGLKSVSDIADVMLPHLGASTEEANLNAARRSAEQLIDFDHKGITSFIVNRDIPEGLDKAYCDLANTIARLGRGFLGGNTSLKMIETSIYGPLQPFANWLLVPIVAGIWNDFDRSMDFGAARKYLEEMGIEYVNRKLDPEKKYGSSITIDLTSAADSNNLKRTSIRGTVVEGIMMVSRINKFEKLYFEPVGHTAFFLYDDRPGVIGTIGMKFANAEINIEDMRNPHDRKTDHSLAIMQINKNVPDKLMREISSEINAISAFGIEL
ncbi:3-phosphoglycerate dehydrogenase family protein [Verrucomicrobiota bacterium]